MNFIRRNRQVGAAMTVMLFCSSCGGTNDNSTVLVTIPSTPAPAPPPTPTPTPAGTADVFALADPGDGAAVYQAYLAKPEVTGIAWRALWSSVEPSDGSWDWSRLGAALDATAAAGKQITIHIGASGGAAPAWLRTAGAATYSGSNLQGDAVTDPVPWDGVYVDRYVRLMQQLASHLSARGQSGLVRAVSVGGPVSEMSLVACANGVLGEGSGAVTYSRSAYLAAWQRTTGAVLAAFPSTSVVVSAPVSQICRPDNDGGPFYTDLMSESAAASVFVADLNALGSQRHAQVTGTIRSRPLFFQTIWSSTNDPTNRMRGTLSDAVCAGRALGSRYFELYKSDLDSRETALRTAVAQARGTTACP